MAFYECKNGVSTGGGDSSKCVVGEIVCMNRTDPNVDHMDFVIPVEKKPKRFFFYRVSRYANNQTTVGWAHPTSMCVYDESISTTQYFIETDDGDAVSTGLNGYYDIGSTYDYTPIRSITDSAITVNIYTEYDDTGVKYFSKYGGTYHYVIFY